MTAKKSASKIFIYVLTLFQLSLISTIAHGQSGKQKVCEPVSVTFKYFQKKNMNFLAGLGTASTEKDKKMYRWHSVSVGINYFPINYLEVGLKVKPTLTKYANIGSLYLTEYIASLRYYPLFIPCRKAALFTGIGLTTDGSNYSIKGENINRNQLSPHLSIGLLAQLKDIRLEIYPEFYFTDRSARINLSVSWNFKNWKMK